jgi:phosphoadenosine phosphosulfate reductase
MGRSIDVFGSHAPKTDWLSDFFDRKENFLKENNLGPDQRNRFKRFLKAAELLEKDKITETTKRLADLGWDSLTSLGIMLANLAYCPQFEWYIKNLDIGKFYTRAFLMETLKLENSEITGRFVLNAFKRIVQTPFGMTLNFGYVDSEDNFTRNKCHIGSPLVVLYSLYKFAEACGDYYEFTVSRLLNYNIDSDGISPTQIFGIEEDELKTILQGLTASNPDFITAKFTHDLDTISLNRNKTASEVLELL